MSQTVKCLDNQYHYCLHFLKELNLSAESEFNKHVLKILSMKTEDIDCSNVRPMTADVPLF